eukprot:scaffold2582_cov162-Ochromonas_danica.AAC.20
MVFRLCQAGAGREEEAHRGRRRAARRTDSQSAALVDSTTWLQTISIRAGLVVCRPSSPRVKASDLIESVLFDN